jgi:hypothetical protein
MNTIFAKRKRRYTGPSKSLIASKLLNPELQLAGFLGKIRQEVSAILNLRITEVRLKKHMLWVAWKGKDGRTCSQFFSYRKLPIWQELVIAKILECPDLRTWGRFSRACRWEYHHFSYVTEMRDYIDEALDSRLSQLKAQEWSEEES